MSTHQEQPGVPESLLDGLKPDPHRGEEIDCLSPGERAPGIPRTTNIVRWAGVAIGLVLAVVIFVGMKGAGVPHNAALTAGVAVLMAAWWMTEAIPIPATALVPLVVFPTLSVPIMKDGEADPITFNSIGASYGNSTIFLFLGGFLIALALQRWNLHRRIALLVLKVMPNRADMMVAGFMIATGFMSMWVSNTATAVMMLPIGLSVLVLVNQILGNNPKEGAATEAEAVVRTKFGSSLMLGIAYAASIGSVATIIGTPPNAFLVGYMKENFDVTIGFGQWMIVGLPLAIVMMAAAWFLLVKVLFKPEVTAIPGGRELIREELDKLGPTSTGERMVLGVFILTAIAWITIPLFFEKPPIDDAGIAIAAGLLLFTLPAGANRGVKLLDWKSAKELPWDVLLLFGGGLALSSMFGKSGLTKWIGEVVAGLQGIPTVVLVALLALAILFLTELTSNTATAATFVPVAGGVAMGMAVDPMLLAIPVALAATFAFMLPVATPPNAVAYGSGYITIGQMVKAGLWLNFIGVVLITATVMLIAVPVFQLM